MPADMVVARQQLVIDPRCAVVAEFGVDRPDLFDQYQVLRCPGPGRLEPVEPVVVARPRYAEDSTQRGDGDFRVGGLLRTDVGVDVYWSTRRAKKASAFPKISSSSSLRASSFSSRRILS